MLAPSPPVGGEGLATASGGAFSSGSLNIFAGMRTVQLLKRKRRNFFSMQFLPPVRCYRFTLFSVNRNAGCQSDPPPVKRTAKKYKDFSQYGRYAVLWQLEIRVAAGRAT